MRLMLCVPVMLLALAGCSASTVPSESGAAAQADIVSAQGKDAKAPGNALTIALPQLAYEYALGFRLPANGIAAAQAAHLALCDRLGPARCQLLAVSRDGDGDGTGNAKMKLRVASDRARGFSDALQKAVADRNGRTVDTQVKAEDVSKDIVDASARIRQRELLVARLTEILTTRKGTVAELVEAERSVAQAQEELDQAKGWLTELRQRVASSTFDLSYDAVAPAAGGAFNIGEALGGSAGTFFGGVQALIVILIYLLPWLALVAAGIFGVRWLRRRVM